MADKLTNLHRNLTADGYQLGSLDDFKAAMADSTKASNFYKNLTADGYQLGSQEEFINHVSHGLLGPTKEIPVPDEYKKYAGMGEEETLGALTQKVAESKQGLIPENKDIDLGPSVPEGTGYGERNATNADNLLMAKNAQMLENLNQRKENLSKVYGKNGTRLIKSGNGVVETGARFNPETKKVEKTYTNETGQTYDSKASAEYEQEKFFDQPRSQRRAAIDKAMREWTKDVDAQLEQAYSEKKRLEQELQKYSGPGDLPKGWGTSMYQAQYGVHHNNSNMDKHGQIKAAIHKLDDTISLLEDKKQGKMDDFWNTFGREISNYITRSDLQDALMVRNAASMAETINKKKASGQELNEEELIADALLHATTKDNFIQGLYGNDYGTWAKAGRTTGMSLEMIPDFILGMKGFGGLAKGGIRYATRAGLKTLGKDVVKRTIPKLTIKATGATAGSLAAGAAMTNTIWAPKLATEITKNMVGDVEMDDNGQYKFENQNDFLSSLLKAEQSLIPEAASEFVGDVIPGGTELLKKLGLSKISGYLERLSGKKWYKSYSDALKRTGFHGTVGEVFEEYANVFDQAILGDLSGIKSMADPDTHIDIWLGTLTTSAFLNSFRMYGAARYYQYKHATDKADKVASFRLTEERWKPWREKIDNTLNKDMKDVAKSIINDESLETQEKVAMLKYIRNLTELRGYDLGHIAKSKEEQESTPAEKTEKAIDDSYAAGYETKNPEERRAIQSDHKKNEDELFALGEDFAKWVTDGNEGDVAKLEYMKAHSDVYTPEQIAAAKKYYISKAAVNGLTQSTEDRNDIEGSSSGKPLYSTVVSDGGKFVVTSYDYDGNVVGEQTFDDEDSVETYKEELRLKREQQDIADYIKALETRKPDTFADIIANIEKEQGWEPGTVRKLVDGDPMKMSLTELDMLNTARDYIKWYAFPTDEVHTEHNQEEGYIAAEQSQVDTDTPDTNTIASVVQPFIEARENLEKAFAKNEEFAEQVKFLENSGRSEQEVLSMLDTFFADERAAITNYYNTRARLDGFMNRSAQKIEERVQRERSRRTFKGTINGQPDQENLVEVTDGENTYTLLNGNITVDQHGRVTGSDSGMLIALDQNGDFVSLGDDATLSVLPTQTTLDTWEQAFREQLQVNATNAIDPTGALSTESGEPAGEAAGTVAETPAAQPQGTVVENGEQPVVEAGQVTGGNETTGALAEPSAKAEETATKPAIESVTDKDGIKRYENGIAVDDAIEDIIADGFDVNEVADASIAEAQAVIDKINGKQAKTRKDLADRKKAQDVIDYYNKVKQRNRELYPPYVDPQPYVQQMNQATSKKKADEILNAALQAGVKAEEIQPAHTQKVQDLMAKEEEERRKAEEITEKDLQDIAEKKGTPEGRRWLLDRKRVPSYAKRIKIAKLVYGDLFDDDFAAVRDLRELISSWIGKGRALDPDTFGQELGWDMTVGKDAAKVSTMFDARRKNGGDGMLFNDFVHMVAEASDGRFDTEEVRNTLIDMFQGAQEKYDLTEYQLQSRVEDAEKQLQAEQAAEEAHEEPTGEAEGTVTDGMMPFAPQPEDEERPAFLGEEGTNSDTMQENQPKSLSREEYLTLHPLTEEQIMADTEATEDEKLTAIEYMKGEDDRAIARFIYDTIYERAQQKAVDQITEIAQRGKKTAKAEPQPAEKKGPRWQYELHYDKETGRAWITRDDVSGPIPIGDGRFRIEGKSLDELRGILENPANKLGELLKEIEPQLRSEEIGEQLRKESNPEKAIDTAAKAFREEQKAKDQKDIDDALKEFNDFLEQSKGNTLLGKFFHKGIEGNDKAQANLLDALTLTNAAQRAFIGDLLRLASKVGYAYIKSGVHDVQAWSKQMADSVGRKLKDVLGWDDALINDFVDEVWEQKYTVNGERMRLREHAEKLKNNKEADQAVNVNKKENNEAENDVSLQQKAAKPAEELEGDSAEFAERQKKIAELSQKVRSLLTSIVEGTEPSKHLSHYKKMAADMGLNISDTDLQEVIEACVVDYARDIANREDFDDKLKFEHITALYQSQPTLSTRDNDRINKQQYSTPAPMAFLMGKFVSEGKPLNTIKGLEPSAGNGMLTINLPKENMHVNDIDEMRLSNLQKQGFGQVTSQDGTKSFGKKKYDIIVTNPPFGSALPKEWGVFEISSLEQQMALNALDAMKDDGRAAIIIGGNTEYKRNGAVQGKDRQFLNYLYQAYNVVDVINMDGKALYTKQGTGYPVRMILINGRKPQYEAFVYAPVRDKARAEQVKTYEELYKRVNDDILSNANQPASVHDTESGESRGVDDTSNVGGATQTGVRNVQSQEREGQSSERPADGRAVSGSNNTTRRADKKERPSVDRGLFDVESGSEVNEPSGSTTTEEQQRNGQSEPRGNDTQRPSAESSSTERVGQRRTTDAQQSEQPEPKRSLGTEKVPYRKQSGNAFTLNSLMPAEQADVVKKALEELGDVDQFLVDELGYSSKDELYQALAAEQIDSVAMAIHQMNQGSAFIIGDQTGIGKGRQAAALIRYGVKKGGFPVFITVKKGLFSDMYRDLCDIGSPKLRPFIWSADDAQHSGNVTDKDGNVIYEMPSAKEQKRVVDYINKYGKLPKEYDYVLTTYDSFKSGTMDYEDGKKKPRKFAKGKTAGAVHINGQAKRDALEQLAQNSYVIMDESHNAGGEGSNVSNYLQYITTKAKGLTFLSATFAKRPGNMPIYSLKTAISKAGVKVSDLIDAVKRGGATFQEIMSKALTEAGQMIRRERDMTGVTIDWRGIDDEAVIQKQREQYDKIIGLFNDIINFQRTYIDPIIDQLNDDAAEEQGEVDHTPGTRDMGINNTPFASRTYNMVQQVLLSLKAEETAKRAIEHLKAGRKPVITVANTNEGAADAVAATDGESMEMPDLGVNLKKGLQGTLRIQKKDANGDATQSMIPFERLPQEAQQRYAEIMEAIENSSSGLSLSPIDVIKNELKKAGYKVGELTGRQAEFVYNEDGTVKRVRRQDTDKKKVAADFNNGNLDALILNRSAGTGISLHASTKFDDQRQRIMIVAQAQGDVNDEVQIRGRIDRTGQVLRGMYEYVVSQIPSEQRLLMMLKAKLRSLDANTTSSQKSKFNEMNVQDIINKYGDQIVVQYLAEHPDTYDKLADPLKWGDAVFVTPPEALVESASTPQGDGATASKVLGRMALLKVAEQEKMLDEISDLYQTEIDRLNETGENDLEITEMPLKAKTLSKQVWEQGIDPDSNNPFADNTYVEKVTMDVLRKPMKASEVKAAQDRLLDGKTWEEYKQATLAKFDEWSEQKKAETTNTITERAKKKAEAEQEHYIKGAKKAQEKTGMSDEEIEKNGQFQYDNVYKEEIKKLDDALAAIDSQKQVFIDAFETFSTDGVYALPQNIYDLGTMTFEPGFGKLIDIKITDNMSPNASTISFATLDGRRKITIPINGKVKQQKGDKAQIIPTINSLTAQTRSGWFGQNMANTLKVLEQNTDNWDKLTSTAARKEGYIITGNLLKALVSTREQGVGGKLISYTTDTGDVRQGILMPDNFEPKGLTSKTPISAKKDDLKYDRDKVESADGEVVIRVTPRYDWNTHGYDTLELSVPKSSKRGAKYFNDETLLSLVSGQFEGSSKMKAEFPRRNLDAVLKRLDELGVTVAEEHKEDDSSDSGRRYDEDIEKGSTGRSIDEVRPIIEALNEKYNSVDGVCVSLSETGDRELINLLLPDTSLEGLSEDDIRRAADKLRENFKNSYGCYDYKNKKIYIFADVIPEGKEEEAFFHENIHAILHRWYGDNARAIADRFWDETPSEIGTRKKSFVENNYEEKRVHDEWFTYNLADAMVDGEIGRILDYLKTDEAAEQRINNILNEIGYDRGREEAERKGRAVSERSRRKDKEQLSHPLRGLSSRQKRIAKHIDGLAEKLGTKARTTVYHSFDELPDADKEYIRKAERRGRKVRGWYENGHVYLYLPHIDSEYQAEKTIWHETVAHHGLRQLIGEENLNKLLAQLWLTHKDGEMGRWVTDRMTKNGWRLNEAIEEYLAREAEKNPFKEPGLWQRLKWMLSEVLHKMGFASDPTLSDVQYLFWVSQNQLRDGDPMTKIRQQAFLNHLEREAANTPYVNLNAAAVEDIYNPDAEDAYDDGVRHSEETDEEVIERLEKEPKVKVYRAMQLIDGKLYPPMAAKQNGKLVEPIELGKWEKADEHPEMADENGKFKLDKGNGKSLKAAYNPYIHTSTTMLNDQFSEAQSRPNLVVVECEVPESELTSGYKAEKAKDPVGKMDWKAGVIQGQLSGTREVILSRWDKPVRIVPTEEVAQHIADMIKDKVEVMPSNVVTPQQREALEKLGVKFVETDNRGIIKEGEDAGKSYSSVYGKSDRRYDMDIDEPLSESAKDVYNETLDSKTYVVTEAFQDSMLALKVAQNAIANGKDIPDSQNAYTAENLMHGRNKNEMDLYNAEYRDPIIKTVNKILNKMGWTMRNMNKYLLTKSGLERNRELFVRDWLEKQRKTHPHSYEDLNPEEQDIYDRMENRIVTDFEDGNITEEQRDRKLRQALQDAHNQYLDETEQRWNSIKDSLYHQLTDRIIGNGNIDFAQYLDGLDFAIRRDIDPDYDAEKHDYSGLTAMYGDEKGNYNEADIIDQLMNDETAMNDEPDGTPSETVAELWDEINAANKYALERYRDAGMRTDEQIDRVENMFHFYVPMRGFDANTGEDMYQYFTSKSNANSYVGGLIKQARGRKSMAKTPLSTMFAMSYKAISDTNLNKVKQNLYRLVQANPNNLIINSDSWMVLNERTGEWEEVWPEIQEDATDDEIRQAVKDYEGEMNRLASEGKAKKIKNTPRYDYKPMDKKKRDEHVVEVMVNGQKKLMTVVGNPRAAQALNGHTKWENGRNIFSKMNSWIKNKMASAFTTYSPTFALRNLMRDFTHFRMMLGVREGQGYAHAATKYYMQTLPRPVHLRGNVGMVGLFKKYREGTLDMNKEVERDFKDFMDNGGITGYVQIQKIDDIEKELSKLNKQMKDSGVIKLNNKVWDMTLGLVEAYNEAIENNARFATYRASRHYAGRTKARSAYDAKEITVNFNRKGSGSKVYGFKSKNKDVSLAAQTAGVTSQVLGEGRIFFNATMQAIATTFKNFKNPDGSLNKKYIAKWASLYAIPPFMFGFALPYINMVLASMLGSDDDDEPYANLPEYVRRKNLCFYIGNGNFITIPVGQELAAFLALGDIVAGNTYAPELKPVDKDWMDEVESVLTTFSPVDLDQRVTQGGMLSKDAPMEIAGKTFSVLTPVISVASNKGWTGRPIYKEDRFPTDKYKPEYQQVYQGVNPLLVSASKKLHEFGGGNDRARGAEWSEWNPAMIQYLWEQYTGGPGKTLSNTISLGKDVKDLIFEGEAPEFNMRKVEGLKAFVHQGDDRTQYYRTQAKYFKYKEEADKFKYDNDISNLRKQAKTDPVAKMQLEKLMKGEDYLRYEIMEEANRSSKKEGKVGLDEMRKEINKITDSKEKREKQRQYNELMRAVVEKLDEVEDLSPR